jgi:hypothetical protein
MERDKNTHKNNIPWDYFSFQIIHLNVPEGIFDYNITKEIHHKRVRISIEEDNFNSKRTMSNLNEYRSNYNLLLPNLKSKVSLHVFFYLKKLI